MAFNPQAGPSSHAFPPSSSFSQYGSSSRPDLRTDNPQFDILEWYPSFLSCQKYFLDHAQHQYPVQALAAFVNIQLPYQKQPSIMSSSSTPSPRSPADLPHPRQTNPYSQTPSAAHPHAVSLIPYIRRLIATAHDTDAILHGFFGDAWSSGIGPLHEIERRNFLFAAKSTGWLKVKEAYDMGPDETIPFLSSLANASEKEIQVAETKWSEWLAMQDWMLGPRSPEMSRGQQGQRFKRESND
jgi:hypothetical protein